MKICKPLLICAFFVAGISLFSCKSTKKADEKTQDLEAPDGQDVDAVEEGESGAENPETDGVETEAAVEETAVEEASVEETAEETPEEEQPVENQESESAPVVESENAPEEESEIAPETEEKTE